MESTHGVRYTALMELPYFDCINFTIIDPMHNLFLGTAKYMFKTFWFEKLDKNCLEKMQTNIDNMIVPTILGRIPRKIASSFSSFTADQWKNWTLYFSAVALKNILPKKDYDCWMLFVSACKMLSSVTITTRQLQEGHERLMTFCRTFQQLYGSNCVTPNMHLHTHLIQCIIDFGPMHTFWLYSFERMNGTLGSFNTNKRSVEMQMMRRLSTIQSVLSFEKPTVFASTFASSFKFENASKDTEVQEADDAQTLLKLSSSKVSLSSDWYRNINIEFIGVRHDVFMEEYYLNSLRSSVRTILNVDPENVTGSGFKYSSIVMCGETYGSSESRLSRSSVILASWCGLDGEINLDGNDVRPGVIRFFLTFFIDTNEGKKMLKLAFVNWLQKVHCRHDVCPDVEVWCHKLYEPDGPASFMPVQRIRSKCICATIRIKNEELLAVTPHIRQLYW